MSIAANSSVRMGRWIVSQVPADWFFIPDFGLRHNSPYPTSNITVKEDTLLAGKQLKPYVEAQATLLKRTYLDPVFAGPQPTDLVSGVDEAMLLLIKHQPLNGVSVMQVQAYARVESWLGIITLTTVEPRLMSVRKDFEQFVRSLRVALDETASPQQAQPGVPSGNQTQGGISAS